MTRGNLATTDTDQITPSQGTMERSLAKPNIQFTVLCIILGGEFECLSVKASQIEILWIQALK